MSISVHKLTKAPIDSEAVRPALSPAVNGWPLVGVLPSLLRNPFGFALRVWQQHGDIFSLNLGFTKLILLNHPRHAQHLLRDHAHNYRKGGVIWDAVRGVLGNGLVVSEGDVWLRQRRLLQPQFHRQRLAGLTTLLAAAIGESLRTWEDAATTGQPVELTRAFSDLTMHVVVKSLFGASLSPQVMIEVSKEMAFVLDYLFVDIATSRLPKWLPLPGRRRFQQALARFDEIVYAVIGASRQGSGPENYLLAMLLNTVDEETGAAMDDRQLRDEVATLFLAGYETTSLALAWAVHFLTQHPAVMQQMQVEVDQVLAGNLPTFADLPKLTYTRRVLQESMRLRPPSFWTPRTAIADDEIDGYRIPAGSQVISFTYAIHRHPDFWPDAERFDPDRFTPENSTTRHHFAWLPFGAGQRQCIGRDFALLEGQLALAMLVQRYQVTARAKETIQPVLSGTLRPKGGVTVSLAKRVA
jgi:cytochrome P450